MASLAAVLHEFLFFSSAPTSACAGRARSPPSGSAKDLDQQGDILDDGDEEVVQSVQELQPLRGTKRNESLNDWLSLFRVRPPRMPSSLRPVRSWTMLSRLLHSLADCWGIGDSTCTLSHRCPPPVVDEHVAAEPEVVAAAGHVSSSRPSPWGFLDFFRSWDGRRR